MQTVWKGSISFRLVSKPIRLASATQEKEHAFRDASDRERVQYRRICGAPAVPANRGAPSARHPVTLPSG
jgi:non-homologous end joining protein Ku